MPDANRVPSSDPFPKELVGRHASELVKGDALAALDELYRARARIESSSADKAALDYLERAIDPVQQILARAAAMWSDSPDPDDPIVVGATGPASLADIGGKASHIPGVSEVLEEDIAAIARDVMDLRRRMEEDLNSRSVDGLDRRAIRAKHLAEHPEDFGTEEGRYKELFRDLEKHLTPANQERLDHLDDAVTSLVVKAMRLAVVNHGRQILEMIAGARYEEPGGTGLSPALWDMAGEAQPFLVVS